MTNIKIETASDVCNAMKEELGGYTTAHGRMDGTTLPDPISEAQRLSSESRFITDEDREYASELLADLASPDQSRAEIAAQWFRKARVENALRHARNLAAASVASDDANKLNYPSLPEGEGWQAIETAPKDGTRVWLASVHPRGTKEIIECAYWSAERCAADEGGNPDDYEAGWYQAADNNYSFCRPTHWMPTTVLVHPREALTHLRPTSGGGA